MAYNSLSELFKATADAIRSKTGGTEPIVANDFPAAIEGISGGGSGGGATILKSHSRSAEPEIPVGTFDENHAYYKLWDNTPSFNDLVGAVFGFSYILDEIPEDDLAVIDPEGGVIVWQSSSLSYMPMIVLTQDLIEDGVMILSKGIYVVDNFCSSGLVVLAYGGAS